MTFKAIIEQDEYEHYGVRAHRGQAVVGQTLGNSRVWVDGEITGDELAGISTLTVTAADVDGVVSRIRSEYCWSDEQIVLVAGDFMTWGEDAGEAVIHDNICLAVQE
jgi:hypothetical protein